MSIRNRLGCESSALLHSHEFAASGADLALSPAAWCGKSARYVRCGGGWKPAHDSDGEALPTETWSNG